MTRRPRSAWKASTTSTRAGLAAAAGSPRSTNATACSCARRSSATPVTPARCSTSPRATSTPVITPTRWTGTPARRNGRLGRRTPCPPAAPRGCLTLLDEPWDRALAAYLDAWQASRRRAEPLYEIARHVRLADSFELGYLFAKRASTRFRIPRTTRCSYLPPSTAGGRSTSWRSAPTTRAATRRASSSQPRCSIARAAGTEAPAHPGEPGFLCAVDRGAALRLPRGACRAHQRAGRARKRVGRRCDANGHLVPVRELFERTVNSFLRCCTDIERIGRWICVDNGSAEVTVLACASSIRSLSSSTPSPPSSATRNR